MVGKNDSAYKWVYWQPTLIILYIYIYNIMSVYQEYIYIYIIYI